MWGVSGRCTPPAALNRWAEVPCVNDSGLTCPVAIFCSLSSPTAAAARRPAATSVRSNDLAPIIERIEELAGWRGHNVSVHLRRVAGAIPALDNPVRLAKAPVGISTREAIRHSRDDF